MRFFSYRLTAINTQNTETQKMKDEAKQAYNR